MCTKKEIFAKTKTVIIVIAAIIIIGIVNAQNKPRIAILDFETGAGITQSHVVSLTAILTAYLQEEFEVVSLEKVYEDVNRMISEMNFQHTTITEEQMEMHIAITEQQMEIVDSLLNVSKIIIGSINVARGDYRILASVINTETGTIRPVVGETENARAVSAFPRVAQRLAQRLMAEMEHSEVPVPQEVAIDTLVERDTGRGVLINGVRWATRNVDSRTGTFVASPEMAGRFNQWGVQFVWQGTRFIERGVPYIEPKISRDANRNYWVQYNPCPLGWRVPYRDEFESLIAAGSFWATVNGVGGRVFGTAPNQIFLPAAGGGGIDPTMDHIPTHVVHEGQLGYYWTRDRRSRRLIAYRLRFSPVDATVGVDGFRYNLAFGFSVRCVVQTNDIYIEF